MTTLPSDPAPDGELLDALRAVLEALDVDPGATVADGEIADAILIERAGHAKVMLAGILGRDPVRDISWSTGYLREQLAKHPATGYKTWAERVAELAARQVGSGRPGVSGPNHQLPRREHRGGQQHADTQGGHMDKPKIEGLPDTAFEVLKMQLKPKWTKADRERMRTILRDWTPIHRQVFEDRYADQLRPMRIRWS